MRIVAITFDGGVLYGVDENNKVWKYVHIYSQKDGPQYKEFVYEWREAKL